MDKDLLFFLRYIEDLTNPNTSLVDRIDLNYQFAYAKTKGSNLSDEQESLVFDIYLYKYLDLELDEIHSISLHTHLWMIENISLKKISEKLSKITNLYKNLDSSLLRYAILDLLFKTQINIENWLEELVSGSSLETILECAEILLTLRQYNALVSLVSIYSQKSTNVEGIRQIYNFIYERRYYISGTGEKELLKLLRNYLQY